ncbi:hypothetical protein MGU_07878 [Metarhizium guizhouense ARSEF 977]|uniref:SDR family oxidoreductase n=1 Tax=Metarhizium guizhouense (strain ARSEF 977) TaxID=1276136 RepID=A0A0B4H546_METGA|nr:hypothetical protein MGU_07878 [Metarhizium guizhouense ARSEF 977]
MASISLSKIAILSLPRGRTVANVGRDICRMIRKAGALVLFIARRPEPLQATAEHLSAQETRFTALAMYIRETLGALIRSQAEAWSAKGVLCNAVVPRLAETPMPKTILRTMTGRNDVPDDFG